MGESPTTPRRRSALVRASEEGDTVQVGLPSEVTNTPPPANLELVASRVAAIARQKAHTEGYAQGLEDGRAAAKAEMLAAVSEISRLVANLDVERIDLVQDAHAELLATSLACAEEIVGEEIRRNPRAIEGVVTRVLRTVAARRTLTIELAPAQASLLLTLWSEERPDAFASGRWRVVPVDDLEASDVRVRFENGYLDGRLSVRMQELRQALLESAQNFHE